MENNVLPRFALLRHMRKWPTNRVNGGPPEKNQIVWKSDKAKGTWMFHFGGLEFKVQFRKHCDILAGG